LFTSKGDSLTWRGEFNDTAIYYKNNIVSYNDNLYIAKEYLFYISLSPTENSESWDLFVPKGATGETGPTGATGPAAEGFNWRGEYIPYSNESGGGEEGTGTGGESGTGTGGG
jgi:hypothetical protein